MRAGLILLCLAYVLSQFFRAFLAVLSGPLERDLGATPDDLAFASGLWFLVFAAMQIPVGWALDRVGPRRTAAVLLLIGGGGGAALFAVATTPLHVSLAMALIGVGCAPVLMASYYIFARQFPPARFATLAALMLGVGSVGNLVASYPMAFAAETGAEPAMEDMRSRWPGARFVEDPGALRADVDAAFDRTGEARVHLIGAPFQIKVWEALITIPSGQVTTYSELACAVGNPRAVRAVGTAVGRNPVSWLIPCHRALRKSGGLGGYHWGLPVKRALLAWEAARDEA